MTDAGPQIRNVFIALLRAGNFFVVCCCCCDESWRQGRLVGLAANGFERDLY